MDNEYADVSDIPGNIVIQPYMFEPPQTRIIRKAARKATMATKMISEIAE